MFRVIDKLQEVEEKSIDSIEEYYLLNSIIICERGSFRSNQNLLIEGRDSTYSWTNFYIRDGKNRTQYQTIREAVKSKLEKNYKVYVLSNKTELKEAIKAKS